MKVFNRVSGNKNNGRASAIPLTDPYLLAIRLELQHVRAAQERMNLIGRVLQAVHGLPDGCRVDPDTGVITYPNPAEG